MNNWTETRPSVSDAKWLYRFPLCDGKCKGKPTEHKLVGPDQWRCTVCGHIRVERVWVTDEHPLIDPEPRNRPKPALAVNCAELEIAVAPAVKTAGRLCTQARFI